MNSEIRLLKLTNGEDIIAYVNETPESYHLDNPLVMKVHARVTSKGVQEGLHLSRWIQPFSKETNFSIMRQHVIINTEVTEGLHEYYKKAAKSFATEHDDYEEGPSDEELDEILKQEEEESFLALESPSDKIH